MIAALCRVFRTCRTGFLAGLVLPLAAASPPNVTAEKPWMRYLLPSLPAAGYLVLRNNGDQPAMLTGAASPACGMLMLHESKDDSGMSSMLGVQTIAVPAHGSLALAPGGYHLMCMQPGMKTGETIQVTLEFQDGSRLAVSMRVYGAQDAP